MFGDKGGRGDTREGVTLISEDASFHGSLVVKGSLRIEGVFEGDISDAVDVEIGAKGRVTGDVRTPKLKIDEGAFYEGSCSMGSGDEKPRRRRSRDLLDAAQPADPVS